MRLPKRESREWAELVRKLEAFERSDVHREIVAYLELLRDYETGWVADPTPEKVAAQSGDDLRALLLQRYAYNRAILSVDGLMKEAKKRAEAEEPE